MAVVSGGRPEIDPDGDYQTSTWKVLDSAGTSISVGNKVKFFRNQLKGFRLYHNRYIGCLGTVDSVEPVGYDGKLSVRVALEAPDGEASFWTTHDNLLVL